LFEENSPFLARIVALIHRIYINFGWGYQYALDKMIYPFYADLKPFFSFNEMATIMHLNL
jgi:hypothetical protein